MEKRPLQFCKFVVNEKPFCVWDWDLQDRTISFLDGVDPEYFTYLAKAHEEHLETDEKQFAALAIRASYAQALETLFSFLGAALQAPYCVPAWLVKYQNQELYSLIEKISSYKPIYSSLGYRILTWEDINILLHANLVLEDKEKESAIKEEFAKVLGRFASDFLNKTMKSEYNSIKHGFRVKPGGFYFALGLEEQPGIPAPPEKMHVMGQSKFGSNFVIPENISEDKEIKHHFRLKKYSLNWDPEDMVYGLYIISIFLHNIIAYIKIKNGIEPEQVQFYWHSNEDLYDEPWKRQRTIGINAIGGFEYSISEEYIEKYTKEDILSVYRKPKSGQEETDKPDKP